jgi:nitroreductase
MLNDFCNTLSLLHSRRSGKARDLIAPGPSSKEVEQILHAASRVPDHGKLTPWRFILVATDRREALATVIENAYRAEKPQANQSEINGIRAYALDAPMLIVVLSTPKIESHIPLWEQQLSAGAAIQNILISTHAMGFVANWLTGWPAYSDKVRAALGCHDSDAVAGFIYIGTARCLLEERLRPNPADIIVYF